VRLPHLKCLFVCFVLFSYVLLQIELNTQELSGFQVTEQLVTWRYKYKNLKAALSNIPSGMHKGAGNVSTKVGTSGVKLSST
jgi:hypothetical protein